MTLFNDHRERETISDDIQNREILKDEKRVVEIKRDAIQEKMITTDNKITALDKNHSEDEDITSKADAEGEKLLILEAEERGVKEEDDPFSIEEQDNNYGEEIAPVNNYRVDKDHYSEEIALSKNNLNQDDQQQPQENILDLPKNRAPGGVYIPDNQEVDQAAEVNISALQKDRAPGGAYVAEDPQDGFNVPRPVVPEKPAHKIDSTPSKQVLDDSKNAEVKSEKNSATHNPPEKKIQGSTKDMIRGMGMTDARPHIATLASASHTDKLPAQSKPEHSTANKVQNTYEKLREIAIAKSLAKELEEKSDDLKPRGPKR